MRTAAQETALQRVLRGCCSKEVGGKGSIYVIMMMGEFMQSSTFIFRKFLLVTRNSHHHEGF